MKNTVRALGIMSGTSMDGVDFVLSEVKKNPAIKVRFLRMASARFPKKLKARLEKCARHDLKVNDLAELHFDLGRFYEKCYLRLRLDRWKPDVIGLHGQTVYHRGGGATLQIGEPSFLRYSADVPVVSGFRAADIAAKGQGAPLATFFHKILLRQFFPKGPVAFQNLGGIGNLSFFDGHRALSFDTGPANMPLDLATKLLTRGRLDMDVNGRLASRGCVHVSSLEKLLRDPFFSIHPPKSAGREQFGEAFIKRSLKQMGGISIEDKLATLTELVACSVAISYERFLPRRPQKVVLGGGGSLNPFLAFRIRYHLPNITVIDSADLGWPVQAIEGGAFGLLAACRIWQIPGHLPETTGAQRALVLGELQ